MDGDELGGKSPWGLIKEPEWGQGKEAELGDPGGCLPPTPPKTPSPGGWS